MQPGRWLVEGNAVRLWGHTDACSNAGPTSYQLCDLEQVTYLTGYQGACGPLSPPRQKVMEPSTFKGTIPSLPLGIPV